MDGQTPGAGSFWTRTGRPGLALISQLAGLGVASAGGSAGPPLVALGDYLARRGQIGSQRQLAQQFPEGSPEREQAMAYAAEAGLNPNIMRVLSGDVTRRQALTAYPGVRRDVPYETTFPTSQSSGATPEFAGATGEPSPRIEDVARRKGERPQTSTELLQSIANLNVPEPVKAELVAMALGERGLPTEPTLPETVQRERLGTAERGYWEAAGVAPEIAAAGSRVTEAGGRVAPHILTPKERGEEARVARVQGTLGPQWERQLEGLAGRQDIPAFAVEALRSAISAARADPSPANVGKVTSGFQAMGKTAQASRDLKARLDAQNKRMTDINKIRDLRARLSQATALMGDIRSERARIQKRLELADPVTRAQLEAHDAELEVRQEQLRQYITELSLSEEGTAEGPPGKAPEAAPVPAGSGGVDVLRQKGYVR